MSKAIFNIIPIILLFFVVSCNKKVCPAYLSSFQPKQGTAHKFFAYTENIHREKAANKADFVAPNLNEFLYVNDLPRKISYPKNRIKILLLENVHPMAFENLSEEGFSVELLKHALPEEELMERIKGVHVLGIRSKTQVTEIGRAHV